MRPAQFLQIIRTLIIKSRELLFAQASSSQIPQDFTLQRAVTSNATTQGYWTGLENMKVHKLGVEKAKENTKQHIAARPSAIHPPRLYFSWLHPFLSICPNPLIWAIQWGERHEVLAIWNRASKSPQKALKARFSAPIMRTNRIHGIVSNWLSELEHEPPILPFLDRAGNPSHAGMELILEGNDQRRASWRGTEMPGERFLSLYPMTFWKEVQCTALHSTIL